MYAAKIEKYPHTPIMLCPISNNPRAAKRSTESPKPLLVRMNFGKFKLINNGMLLDC